MQKAYLHLIKYVIDAGHLISVYDGEEWAVKKSNKYNEIKDAIESVEIAELIVRDGATKIKLAWVQVIPYGMEPDETISDNSDNEFMSNWLTNYESK